MIQAFNWSCHTWNPVSQVSLSLSIQNPSPTVFEVSKIKFEFCRRFKLVFLSHGCNNTITTIFHIHYQLETWVFLYSSHRYLADLATERGLQLTTGKSAERTKCDFRCPIHRTAISQASCLICARCRELTFLICCYISLLLVLTIILSLGSMCVRTGN